MDAIIKGAKRLANILRGKKTDTESAAPAAAQKSAESPSRYSSRERPRAASARLHTKEAAEVWTPSKNAEASSEPSARRTASAERPARPARPERSRAGTEDGESDRPRRRRRRGGRGRSRRPVEGATGTEGSIAATEPSPVAEEASPRAERHERAERAPRPERSPRQPREARESREPRGPRERRPRPPRSEEQEPIAEHVADTSPWDPASFEVEPQEGKVRFHDLEIPTPIMRAIAGLGWQYCTPIQGELLKDTLKGTDAVGQAQTGTGKTAAFLITAFKRMLQDGTEGAQKPGHPRTLVIAPTRELVLQIEKDAKALAKHVPFNVVALFGGTGYGQQQKMLEKPVDIIAATPGRLLDFMNQRIVNLSDVEIMIIDEADRMLDMGFIPDVRRIVYATPPKERRQTLFFSATITDDVKKLAESWTKDAMHVTIEPETVASAQIDQRFYVVTTQEKFALLHHILAEEKPDRAIVFANRRDQCDKLCTYLQRYGMEAALLSGALAQNVRTRTLENFREGKVKVLVATDVAGRGLHVNDVSHVINYTLPIDPEDYVHRIGRTGRAGSFGHSISFACEEDAFYIPEIEKYLGHEIKCIHPEEEWLKLPEPVNPHIKAEGRGIPRGRGTPFSGTRGGYRGSSPRGGGGGRSGGGGRR